MVREPNLFAHALREGRRDLLGWAKHHFVSTAVAFIAALLGVPAYLALAGATMASLRDQLEQVASYSLIGPMLLTILSYIYFCLRAPAKLYAKRIDELRDLRVQLGRSIDDLEDAPPPPNRFIAVVRKYGPLTAIMILLVIAGFLFYTLGYIGRAYRISSLLNTVYYNETKMMVILNGAIAEDASNLCDQQKLHDRGCNGMRNYAKALKSADGAYKVVSIPHGLAIVVQTQCQTKKIPSATTPHKE